MDNLLKAIDISAPTKGREDATVDGLSRVADSFRPADLHHSGATEKLIGLPPESLIGLDRIQ